MAVKAGQGGDPGRRARAAEALGELRRALEARLPLGAHPEALRDTAEALGAACVPGEADEAAAAAATADEAARLEPLLGCLGALLRPRHGDVERTAALVVRALEPALLPTKATAGRPGPRAAVVAWLGEVGEAVPDARESIAALARHMLVRAPEAAALRAAALQTVVGVAAGLPEAHRVAVLRFALKMSRNRSPHHRLAAVSFVAPFFAAVFAAEGSAAAHFHVAEGDDEAGTAEVPWGAYGLAMLFQRALDKMSPVRQKAVSSIASILGCPAFAGCEGPLRHWLERLPGSFPSIWTPYRRPQVSGVPAGGPRSIVDRASPFQPPPQTPGAATATPGAGGTPAAATPEAGGLGGASPLGSPAVVGRSLDALAIVRGRGEADPKALVRKAALQVREAGRVPTPGAPALTGAAPRSQVLEALLRVWNEWGAEDLRLVGRAVKDPSVLVRKQALDSAAALVRQFPAAAEVSAAWLQLALPLAGDADPTVKAKALDQFAQLFLADLAAAPARHMLALLADAKPALLAGLGQLCRLLAKQRLQATRHAGSALQKVRRTSDAGRRKPPHLQAPGDERWTDAARRTLPHLRPTARQVCAQGAAGAFQPLHGALDRERTGAWRLLAELAGHSPSIVAVKWVAQQWERAAGAEAGGFGADSVEMASLLRLVGACGRRLKAAQAAAICEALVRALRTFTLPVAAVGPHVQAVAQLCRAKADEADGAAPVRVFTAAVLARAEQQLEQLAVDDRKRAAQWDEAVTGKAATCLFTAGELAVLQAAGGQGVPRRLVQLVQSFVVRNPGAPAIPDLLQAHAWTALGKCCLADEALARQCVPLFFQELADEARAPAVRNNLVVALTDLCVRFTSLVDVHVGKLARCLGDPCELVRRQTLVLLAGLLGKEYVKWRGALFNRFVLALVDPSPAVRQLAEYLLQDPLSAKMPTLAYNHFLETLFAFNNCAGVGGGAALEAEFMTETALQGLEGADERARARRQVIYARLLGCMAPEHKFAVAARLCTDVLAKFAHPASAGGLSLERHPQLLHDALWILASSKIKVGAPQKDEDDTLGGDEGPAPATARLAAAKGALVGSMMKKHLLESVVPIVKDLKALLQRERSPLLGDLMACACELLKDHRADLADLLAADKQFAQEILHDLRQQDARRAQQARERLRAAQQARAREAAGTAAVATPGARLGAPAGDRPVGTGPGSPLAAEVLADAGQRTVGRSGRKRPPPSSARRADVHRLAHASSARQPSPQETALKARNANGAGPVDDASPLAAAGVLTVPKVKFAGADAAGGENRAPAAAKAEEARVLDFDLADA